MVYTSNIVDEIIADILRSLNVLQVSFFVCSKKRSLMVSLLRSLGSYIFFTSSFIGYLRGFWFIYLICSCPVSEDIAEMATEARFRGFRAVDRID